MTHNTKQRALVVGTGISGIATATRLAQAGWSPVLVERATERRRGGYFVALFGAGRIAAERLGIGDRLTDRSSTTPGCSLTRRGDKRPSISYRDMPGNPWLMLRGDVESAAYAALPPDVDVRFGTVPVAIDEDGDGVTVALHDTVDDSTTRERFALVVGCDGLRSTVRRLTFGPDADFVERLGYMVVAFQFPGHTVPGLDRGESAIMHEPGRSMWVFAFADHDPTVLLTYRTDDVDAEFTEPVAQRVRTAFGSHGYGVTLGAVMDALDEADGVLFDSAEQVHMPSWHTSRIVLLGDAAWCTTLYAGMGVSAALAGADLLGAMLDRHAGQVEPALAEWETSMRPYIDTYQKKGRAQRPFFVQANRREIVMRKLVMGLASNSVVRGLVPSLQPNADRATSADIVGTVMGTGTEKFVGAA